MQIRPHRLAARKRLHLSHNMLSGVKAPLCHRFDVGPILNQELHRVPERCTAKELGTALACKGAHLVSWGQRA